MSVFDANCEAGVLLPPPSNRFLLASFLKSYIKLSYFEISISLEAKLLALTGCQ